MSENNSAQSAASGRNQKLLLAAFGVIIVVLVGVIVVISNRPAGTPENTVNAAATPQRAVLVTEDNVQEAIEELSPPVEAPTSYRVRMSATWNFEDGASVSSNAYVENAETNQTPVYFDLVLSETNETVLESPVIPLGASMRSIKLDKPLAAGTYPAVVVYHLIGENQETLSTVRMGVTLIVAH